MQKMDIKTVAMESVLCYICWSKVTEYLLDGCGDRNITSFI